MTNPPYPPPLPLRTCMHIPIGPSDRTLGSGERVGPVGRGRARGGPSDGGAATPLRGIFVPHRARGSHPSQVVCQVVSINPSSTRQPLRWVGFEQSTPLTFREAANQSAVIDHGTDRSPGPPTGCPPPPSQCGGSGQRGVGRSRGSAAPDRTSAIPRHRLGPGEWRTGKGAREGHGGQRQKEKGKGAAAGGWGSGGNAEGRGQDGGPYGAIVGRGGWSRRPPFLTGGQQRQQQETPVALRPSLVTGPAAAGGGVWL